jgi:hypothetical protein
LLDKGAFEMFGRKFEYPKVREIIRSIPPPEVMGEILWRSQRPMVEASLIRRPEVER